MADSDMQGGGAYSHAANLGLGGGASAAAGAGGSRGGRGTPRSASGGVSSDDEPAERGEGRTGPTVGRRANVRRAPSFDSVVTGATSVSGFSEDGAAWNAGTAADAGRGSAADASTTELGGAAGDTAGRGGSAAAARGTGGTGAGDDAPGPPVVTKVRSWSAGSAADSMDNDHAFGEGASPLDAGDQAGDSSSDG